MTGEWDDCGVRQPRRPGVEFRAVGDSERQVVQASPRLVERVLAAVPVLREPQASVQAVVPEEHLAARPAGRVELPCPPEAEHFLIPGRARVNVTNRQSKMVDAADHALLTAHLSPLDHLIQMTHEISSAPQGRAKRDFRPDRIVARTADGRVGAVIARDSRQKSASLRPFSTPAFHRRVVSRGGLDGLETGHGRVLSWVIRGEFGWPPRDRNLAIDMGQHLLVSARVL